MSSKVSDSGSFEPLVLACWKFAQLFWIHLGCSSFWMLYKKEMSVYRTLHLVHSINVYFLCTFSISEWICIKFECFNVIKKFVLTFHPDPLMWVCMYIKLYGIYFFTENNKFHNFTSLTLFLQRQITVSLLTLTVLNNV